MSSEVRSEAVKIEWIRTTGILGVAVLGVLGGWLAKGSQDPQSSSPKVASAEKNQDRGELDLPGLRTTYFAIIADKKWTTSACIENLRRSFSSAGLSYQNARKYEPSEQNFEDQLNVRFGSTYGAVTCQRMAAETEPVHRISAVLAIHGKSTYQIASDPVWHRFIDAVEAATKNP